jgi:hypothetical protein
MIDIKDEGSDRHLHGADVPERTTRSPSVACVLHAECGKRIVNGSETAATCARSQPAL